MRNVGRLAEKIAIVTGAGEGIGRDVAQLFAEEGAAVGILERDELLASRAASEIADATGMPTAFAVADVTDDGAVAVGLAQIAERIGSPSILVNNAGAFVFKGLEATKEDWRTVMDVNVMGPAIVSKHAVEYMRSTGGGAIVNMGSVSGVIAQREFLTYNASKGAVLEMTRCMALDLSSDGIRVNSVSPGGVWSASVQRFAAESGWSRETAGQQPNLGLETMLKRVAEPREVAWAVLFLSSDEASFITGANLMVDGGWTAM